MKFGNILPSLPKLPILTKEVFKQDLQEKFRHGLTRIGTDF